MPAFANAVRALLEHPRELARVIDGAVAWEEVVEESLRHDASVFALPFAFPREDVTLGGHRIRAGDALLLRYSAANRDTCCDGGGASGSRKGAAPTWPSVAARTSAWAPLARLQPRTAPSALFTRFPTLRLAAAPGTPTSSLTINTITSKRSWSPPDRVEPHRVGSASTTARSVPWRVPWPFPLHGSRTAADHWPAGADP
ncbi:cytochrome P450 [Streptomyces sp. NBC_01426]|uniref:hypothetical protein n=1 Tax=Streptomyces sp. NBC_01426 TaxID=2975866 RepID=UPI002E3696DA|nr:hypothetical protein [Streptomyces sp. NBC_01426]